MSVRPDQFVEFFREVYRDPQSGQTFDPFPWQMWLAKRVCGARPQDNNGNAAAPWPGALALPTASGKTACIDIAVFALACQADLSTSQRTAPRRILFVVDRRVIVDEAYRHALELAKRLHEATDGVLKQVADSLRRVAGSDTPLTCHQLRGGMYRDDAWARSPAQPCVIASTVDQIGSRLLFRGYGRSFKSWPVHAGLAGNDSLILLDEAHCANPFLQTVKAVARYRQPPWADEPPGSPFQVVVLSATPPADCGEVFSADEEDRTHRVLGPRLSASKPTRLVVATKAKGSAALRELAVTLAEQAVDLLAEQCQAIAVIVNRVRTACLVDELLAAVVNPDEPSNAFDSRTVKRLRKALVQKGVEEFDHVLMTGRMRPIDRQDVTDVWLERLNAGRAGRRRLERPVFVTATQCLEVGANLDFDAMVSECASLDALRQRFGRLNRTGRPIEAAGATVIRQDQLQAKEPDPIYGEALSATWKQLNDWADTGLVDFGVMAIEARWHELADEVRSKLVPAAPDAPIMLPAHIDCWVQTSPEPEPTPDVPIFLHGPQRGAPEIQVCWRADLQEHSRWPDASDAAAEFERNVIDAVSLCPPTTLECLTVPRHLFLRWWVDMAGEVANELTDVESSGTEMEAGERRQNRAVGLIWRGPRDSRLLRDPRDLRPGDTVVLPDSIGGWDVFGHVPLKPIESIDVAERCHWEARRKAVLRLRTDWLDRWPETETGAREAIKDALEQFADDPDAMPEREQLLAWLHEIAAQDAAPGWLRDAILHGLPRASRPELLPHPFGGLVIRGRIRVLPADRELTASETFTTEDDTASATEQITLEQHGRAVGERARRYAELCGLDRRLAATLELAGRLHDLGKADRRYQAFLFGGNRRVAELAADVYAKSAGLRDNRRSYDDAWTAAGLPDSFRHEMLSVQLVEQCRTLIKTLVGRSSLPDNTSGDTADADAPQAERIDRDLLLHLIAMHHGYGRPLAPVVFDEAGDEELTFWLPAGNEQIEVAGSQRRRWPPPHRLDSGVAERFWCLVRRYGWWGLAWLEAIFVLADHRTSEAEAETATRQNTGGSHLHPKTAGVAS